MYYVEKEFKFEYAHRLFHLGHSHKCSNIHGHSGKVKVRIEYDKLNNAGFVIDFNELKFIKDFIDENWDHALMINAEDMSLIKAAEELKTRYFIMPSVTSSEEIAKFLFNFINQKLPFKPKKLLVSIKETDNNEAGYFHTFSS